MSKEVIALDVDEVLFPFVDHFIEYDKQRHSTVLQREDFFCYAFEQIMNVTLEESLPRVYDFNGSNHDHIQPLERAIESVHALAERFELVAVTARHPQFEVHTRRWLDNYLEGVLTSVKLIGYAPAVESPVKKVDVCQELGAIALIDDSVGHIAECAAQGVEGVLFGDYPWNQVDVLPAGVTRCEDWPAVLEYFDARR